MNVHELLSEAAIREFVVIVAMGFGIAAFGSAMAFVTWALGSPWERRSR